MARYGPLTWVHSYAPGKPMTHELPSNFSQDPHKSAYLLNMDQVERQYLEEHMQVTDLTDPALLATNTQATNFR